LHEEAVWLVEVAACMFSGVEDWGANGVVMKLAQA